MGEHAFRAIVTNCHGFVVTGQSIPMDYHHKAAVRNAAQGSQMSVKPIESGKFAAFLRGFGRTDHEELRHAARRMGGRLEVESGGTGDGTTVACIIPNRDLRCWTR